MLFQHRSLQMLSGLVTPWLKESLPIETNLQGFYENDQLFEVYYLDRETGNQILNSYQVINKPDIHKIDINSASFKEVLKNSIYRL